MKTEDTNSGRDEDNTWDQKVNLSREFSGNRAPENNITHTHKYRCLLKCEGGKTYNHPGFCPDCNMPSMFV